MEDTLAQKIEIPSEPKPDLIIRTMRSDIDSFKKTGGLAPIEEGVSLMNTQNNNVSGYSSSEQGIFSAGESSLYNNFQKNSTNQSSGGKNIMVAIVVIAIVGGLGFLTYVIALKFFSK